ncbi:MaoC family dehydratase [Nocardioides sp. WL0053]|uniref:MaoC family dehydratase n=1 Tax=Nocardioides jiangsuensis TaxID=2866161 RepID=A0ABS7RHI3_9ACTN|nr:MaoC family dehydratase [Nocardioides jiangsuensis]MBY9074494.1 MaoC family dehydratase [Nocardioides jiangsuensis]
MSISVGDTARISKTITEADILMYAAVSLDTNPVHLDAVAAEKSLFGERIAHGMLTAGLISACLGTRLPGPGTIYLGQTLEFSAPVRIGDTITAQVEVVEVGEKGRVRLATRCTNVTGETVLSGEATVLPPRGET